MKSHLFKIIIILLVGWVLSGFRPPKNAKDSELPVAALGQIPVVQNGRLLPFDSLARTSLILLRHKQTLNLEPWKGNFSGPKTISATEWLAELITDSAVGDTRPCFRIDNPDLKGLLKLPQDADEAAQTDGKHFSWNQLQGALPKFEMELSRISGVPSPQRDAFQRAAVELSKSVSLYRSLRTMLGPAAGGNLEENMAAYRKKFTLAREAMESRQSSRTHDASALNWAEEQLSAPLIIPPSLETTEWKRVMEAIGADAATPSALHAWASIAAAWKSKDAAAAKTAITAWQEELAQSPDNKKALRKGKIEQLFNSGEPFYKGLILSVLAFLCILAFWLTQQKYPTLRLLAVSILWLQLIILTGGLIFRMVQEGRPPVTNLYSSAIFIGWGSVILGLIIEGFTRHGLGAAVASLSGFGSLMIAHALSLDGDTMTMLVAVLDTNSWLATHVVSVTLGYVGTFIAGFIGIVYVARRLQGPLPDSELRQYGNAAFAIQCFAVLFSFVGTVLGGIWADQSWGRFWGWDSKENGALMIVLLNALVLHARLGGMARARGVLLLSVLGNIICAWSWFGTNMLGIGLHSYGFMDGAAIALWGFVAFNLLVIVVGLFQSPTARSHAQTA